MQSRKTYCDLQFSQNNLKKPGEVKRNSFIYSTVTGNSRAKRTTTGAKPKQSVADASKAAVKSRPDAQLSKKTVAKRVF